MTEMILYSVRMHASVRGAHVSGAERIVAEPLLGSTVQSLVARARAKGAPADQITVTIDAIDPRTIRQVRALDVTCLHGESVAACRTSAAAALTTAGVAPAAIRVAMDELDRGPSRSGENMRGAMIMDSRTGERLEPDRDRGIRATRFDWTGRAGAEARERLASFGLTHARTYEALALASKVAGAPGIVAELCWSDDPDYTAGYVAGPQCGYLRLPLMKRAGIAKGGRVLFIDRTSWNYETFREYLQTVPVLIAQIGTMRAPAEERPA